MLELREISDVLSGLAIRETSQGPARFMRLSDLTDLRVGRNPNFARGEAPAVGRALVIEDGDLVVAARGASTDVLLASDGVVGSYVSLDLYLVRPDRARVNPRFLYAFLTLPATQAMFALKKQGSSLARLPKDELEQITVPLPPMHVQQQIADLAACVDEERNLLNRLSELKSAFGREIVARAISDATRSNQ